MDVIDSKLIESKNCIILSDLIRNLPSVQLIDGQLNIRSGSGWSYGTGSRVLVMVDDMPILSADQGEVDFNLIPMETIDKIEKGDFQVLKIGNIMKNVDNIDLSTKLVVGTSSEGKSLPGIKIFDIKSGQKV